MQPDFESKLVQTDGSGEQTEWQQLSEAERQQVRGHHVLQEGDFK